MDGLDVPKSRVTLSNSLTFAKLRLDTTPTAPRHFNRPSRVVHCLAQRVFLFSISPFPLKKASEFATNDACRNVTEGRRLNEIVKENDRTGNVAKKIGEEVEFEYSRRKE